MTVFSPNSVILYVDDVAVSTDFYRQALGCDPIETFEDFSVFPLGEGVILGLQTRSEIDPKAAGIPGSVELSMSRATREEVDELYRAWSRKDIPMALDPTELDFGYTFVATDPDGHRLRVCATDTSNF